MKLNVIYFKLILLIISGNNIFCNSDFNNISINEGLPGSNITTIFQDSYGYMWFGIEESGLICYQGNRFINYNANASDSSAISNNYIRKIVEDARGNLWIGTENGLSFFYRSKRRFYNFYPTNNSKEDFINNHITSVCIDKGGNLWIGHNHGLHLADSNLLHGFYKHLESNPENNPFDINFTPDNYFKENYYYIPSVVNINEIDSMIWVCGQEMLYRINRKDRSSTIYRETGQKDDIINNHVRFIIKIKEKQYLVGTDRGIAWFNPISEIFTPIHFNVDEGSIDNKDFHSGIIDLQGNIWLAYSDGVLVSLAQNGNYEFSSLNNSIGDNAAGFIKEIFIDRSGMVWMGSKYNGLYVYNKDHLFPSVNFKFDQEPDPFINHVLVCKQDNKDNVWIGTKNNGLLLMNTEKSKYEEYFNYSSDRVKKELNRVEDIIELDDGTLIAACLKGLGLFNVKSKEVQAIKFQRVVSLLKDSKNNIWLGTNKGVYMFDLINKKPFRKVNNYYASPFFSDEDLFITTITESLDGNIYFGTRENGLFIYDPIQESIQKIALSHKKWQGIMIRNIINQSDSSLWIATKHAGLFRLNNTNEIIEHYDQSKGLPSNTVYSILFDKNGDLWAGTHHGLSKLSIKNNSFVNFNINHGLKANIFESNAKAGLRSGEIIIGGHKGLNLFNPDSISLERSNARLIISNIKINNKLHFTDVTKDTSIRLSHNQNFVTFDFAYLDYRLPQTNEYKFKLEGIDKNWVSSKFQNEVTYPALNHGNYKFQIKAMGLDNEWSDILNVDVIIKPPFWVTNLAFVVYFVILSLIVWFVINYSKQRFYYKNQIKEAFDKVESTIALNRTKLSFFTNISHELRTPLSLIMGPIENLLSKTQLSNNDKQQVELISRNAKKLNYMVNQLLYFRKTEQTVAGMNVSEGDIVDFTKEILFPYYELAASEKIVFNIISDQSNINLWFDPDKVEKILSNLMMNAYKYTPKGGSISVYIKVDKIPFHKQGNKNFRNKKQLVNAVCISVVDTGVGMSSQETQNIFERFFVGEDNRSGIGMGLDLVQMLVEMHGGTITVDSTPGKGSSFHIWFRFGNKHFDKKYISANEIITSEFVKQVDEDILDYDKAEQTHQEIVKGKKKYQLLVVEDNKDMRFFLQLNLENEYNLLMANDGKEGLKLAFEENPDLIISDIMMPEMDGIEMCTIIKSEPSICHIPVILLTAKSQLENKLEGLAIGADDYIEKPFSVKLLDLKLKNFLRTHEKIKQQVLADINKGLEPNTNISDYDVKFLKNCTEAVSQNYGDPNFNVLQLSKLVNMSRSQLHRKLKGLVDKTPVEWIYDFRLEKAKELLNENRFNVTDVAYMTGFNSPSSFSTVFKKKYKIAPSELLTKRDKSFPSK